MMQIASVIKLGWNVGWRMSRESGPCFVSLAAMATPILIQCVAVCTYTLQNLLQARMPLPIPTGHPFEIYINIINCKF